MMKKYIPYALIVVALALALVQGWRNAEARRTYEARIAVLAADSARRHHAAAVSAEADSVRLAAQKRGASVKRAETRARVLAETARADAVAAPDTCRRYIDAYEGALQGAHAWIDTLSVQRDEYAEAAARFKLADSLNRARADSLAAATRRLSLTPSRRSYLPRYGVGVAVGVNPITGRPSATAGLTLSWSF